MSKQAEKTDYANVIVNKPWGYEYLMYENDCVGIWFLHIRHGAKTSLHCHPRKKTGLILLSGEAVVTFLNGSTQIKGLNKMMIREGLFHSTAALSKDGISVIETETPCDKGNLVRLEDEYGREEKPYEGSDAHAPIKDNCIQLSHPEKGQQFNYSIGSCSFSVEMVKDVSGLRQRPLGEIEVILDGGLVSRTGEPVVGPGDVVSSDTLDRLAEVFSAPNGTSLLSIRNDGQSQPKSVNASNL